MQRFFPLDKVNRRAPLGLRFFDMVRGVYVNDQLVVSAWQIGTSGPKQVALSSPLSGVYGFRTLLGLRRFEDGERPASDWCGIAPPDATPPDDVTNLGVLQQWVTGDENAPKANFIVYVEDRLRRFLPQMLLMCLPKERLIEVPLFSSPARVAPAGLGVVRGQLVTHTGSQASKPASWAFVTATLDTRDYIAVADARGMFALFVPYASVLPSLRGIFPQGGSAVDQLSWQLTMRVFYQPLTQHSIAGVEPPDILTIMKQGRANVYAQVDAAPLSELATVIRFGVDLVVVTEGKSQLFVDPVGP
ncbi:MAG: hypothetical protein NVS4B11_29410 [Ktedonobacteraceae bacterium]